MFALTFCGSILPFTFENDCLDKVPRLSPIVPKRLENSLPRYLHSVEGRAW